MTSMIVAEYFKCYMPSRRLQDSFVFVGRGERHTMQFTPSLSLNSLSLGVGRVSVECPPEWIVSLTHNTYSVPLFLERACISAVVFHQPCLRVYELAYHCQ